MSGSERFQRSGRLTRGSEVRLILRTGRRNRRMTLDIHWSAGTTGHPRLGLIVPRFRQTAVARNRLQRRLRELWRREVHARVTGLDVVVRARPDAYRAPFSVLRADLLGWCEVAAG